MELVKTIMERKSIRAFKSEPIPKSIIEEIMKLTIKAPSAINLQPWEFYVVYGEEKDRLSRTLIKAYNERGISCGPSTNKPLNSVYSKRGMQTSELMKEFLVQGRMSFDKFVNEGSCYFYGAPVAIIICMDKCFTQYHYIDIGVALAYLILAAHEYQLATCPIGLISAYEDEIKEELNIPDNKEVVIGVALGYPDLNNPVNKFKSPRGDLNEFIKWIEY